MSAAIADMQRDPQAAMRKYANDKEVTNFILAFMRLMGGHMEQLGAAEEAEERSRREKAQEEQRRAAERASKPRQADPAQVQRWMSDPTIRVSALTNANAISASMLGTAHWSRGALLNDCLLCAHTCATGRAE